MKRFLFFVFLAWGAFVVYAQPVNKVYWVGPNIGADLTSPYWASTSGGLPGPYPADLNTQLIFDGGVTAGQSFFINITTGSGGYFVVSNNTAVILRRNPGGGFFDFQISGCRVDSASQLVFENTGTGALLASLSGSIRYNSTVTGEMVMKAPVINCTQTSCAEIWLNLSGFATPFPPTFSLSVSGTLRMQGTKALINSGASSYLVFGANSNFILDTDQTHGGFATFHPASTITITGAGKGTPTFPTSAYLPDGTYGNVVYDCPAQTVSRRLFSGNGWTVNGKLTVKNTGSGTLVLSSGTVIKN